MSYEFLQLYWWGIISLVGALFVFLMFVQGGQSYLFSFKKEEQKSIIINSLKHKWGLTFTTLVLFGGAFFAAFPLFYAVSFGGAYALWMIILLCFILQAVAFHYRAKPNNLLGKKTFDLFLWINGVAGVFFIGLAVAAFFTGMPFAINTGNILENTYHNQVFIMHWNGQLMGLEALFNLFNIAFALMLVFLSKIMGLLYFFNTIQDNEFIAKCGRLLKRNFIVFLACFAVTFILLFTKEGYASDNNHIYLVKYKYLVNYLQQPLLSFLWICGAAFLLFAVLKTIFNKNFRNGFWFGAIGVVAVVFSVFMIAGINHTAYYPSSADIQSSLTINNSCSSYFTLKVMTYASFFIPAVLAYIAFAWRALSRK